jgi:RNA polymerase sigma-70 factor (ECF subfamily)
MQVQEDRLRSLMLQGLAGDASSHHCLLIELSAHLRAFLRRRLSRYPEEVEDLVQELLFAIHTQRHTYDARRPLTAWVHAIARYKLIDLLRRRSRTDLLHDPFDDQEEMFGHADTEASDASYDVARLLEALPDRQRLPILYVKIDGSSVADTARRTGMSESAVKVGIHRGLKLLAQKMRGTI